ncbi:hypothetical protein ACVW1A_003653 [Bradyrhizobium sp. LB1.3]
MSTPVLGELLHLAGRDGGCHQLAGLGVVVEALELRGEPIRHGGAGAGDEGSRLLEIVHGHDARHNRDVDAAGADAVEIAEVEIVIEEHLRDRSGRTRIDLGLQRVDIIVEVARLGVLLGVRRDRHFDVGVTLLDAGHERIGRLVAVGMAGIGRADAACGIAAQADDVADADLVIAVDDLVDLAARGADAGQMRGRQQRGFLQDTRDGRVGALTGRATGAISHRDEFRVERGQPVDGVPEIALHILGLGRKELEGDRRPLLVPVGLGSRRHVSHGHHSLQIIHQVLAAVGASLGCPR